jgi:hypothetical protein
MPRLCALRASSIRRRRSASATIFRDSSSSDSTEISSSSEPRIQNFSCVYHSKRTRVGFVAFNLGLHRLPHHAQQAESRITVNHEPQEIFNRAGRPLLLATANLTVSSPNVRFNTHTRLRLHNRHQKTLPKTLLLGIGVPLQKHGRTKGKHTTRPKQSPQNNSFSEEIFLCKCCQPFCCQTKPLQRPTYTQTYLRT